MNYISLTAEDFDALVRGAPVTRRSAKGVEFAIILSDIGWDRMLLAIQKIIPDAAFEGEAASMSGD